MGKNFEGSGHSILRCYPGIFLYGLRKTTTNFSQDNMCPGREVIKLKEL
jgi:hypothetical protein